MEKVKLVKILLSNIIDIKTHYNGLLDSNLPFCSIINKYEFLCLLNKKCTKIYCSTMVSYKYKYVHMYILTNLFFHTYIYNIIYLSWRKTTHIIY